LDCGNEDIYNQESGIFLYTLKKKYTNDNYQMFSVALDWKNIFWRMEWY